MQHLQPDLQINDICMVCWSSSEAQKPHKTHEAQQKRIQHMSAVSFSCNAPTWYFLMGRYWGKLWTTKGIAEATCLAMDLPAGKRRKIQVMQTRNDFCTYADF